MRPTSFPCLSAPPPLGKALRDKPQGAGWISCRPPVPTAGDTAHPWKGSQREGPALCCSHTSLLLSVFWDDNRKLHFLGMIMRKPKLLCP